MLKHPARYTDAFLPVFAEWLDGRERVLDPFGGTGKLKQVCPRAICMDIEAEWAQMAGLRSDATRLPFAKETFDAICTSPTYANRMADKTPGRVSYAARLGKPLHPQNTGGMQWGEAYRNMHIKAWGECYVVLKRGGILILNIKDHIRAKQRVYVTDWHIECLTKMNFRMIEHRKIDAPGAATHLRNGDARVPYESVILFERP